jgi:hypothetical protein
MSAALEIKVRSPLHGDRIWRCIGERGHVTCDGREMVLAVWQTPCVICGEPFEILSTRVTRADQGHFKKLVTCPRHRMTLSESTALRFARGDKSRRLVFEMIRRDKLSRSPGRANG